MRDLAERREIDLDVYEPAEDSRLLAAAVCNEIDQPDLVVDVGTGSGYVADRIREVTEGTVIGTDRNPQACRRAADRGIPTVRCDLLAPIQTDSADLVTFNPPYLPTDPDADHDDWLSVAVSGGQRGRMVIDRFLASVGRVLVADGVAYLLVSTYTGIDAVARTAAEHGFHVVAVAEDHYPGETLTVLKLLR